MFSMMLDKKKVYAKKKWGKKSFCVNDKEEEEPLE